MAGQSVYERQLKALARGSKAVRAAVGLHSRADVALRVGAIAMSAGLCAGLAVTASCSSKSHALAASDLEPRAVSFSEFLAGPDEVAQDRRRAGGQAPKTPSDDPRASAGDARMDDQLSPPTPGESGAVSSGDGAVSLSSIPAPLASVPAPTIDPAPVRGADTVIIESKVGQINGRPVLASQILEPLDGRLRAMAIQQKDPNVWRREAARLITSQLISRVRDELVLAEAQSSLTSEQRQGLIYFLGRLQENLVSAQGGSAVQADEALRSSVGRSLQEEAQDQLDRELIEFELRSKVSPRVAVPYRQIRLEYDRQSEKFNPAPTATFRMIWIDEKDQATLQSVTTSLTPETFANLAGSATNQFLRDKQGRVDVQLKSADLSQTQLFSMGELDAAAHKLSPGQVSPPTPIKGYVAFIKYEALDQPRIVPLYEAQLELEQALRERRFTQETTRYFERLFDRGSFSDIESMTRLLLEIAVQRYQPRGT